MKTEKHIDHVATRKHYEEVLSQIVEEKFKVAKHMTMMQREVMLAEHRAQFDEESV